MANEQRLIDLERELIETRRAAVSIIVDMASADPEGRGRLADGLDRDAGACDAAHARLSRLVAAALRRG